MHKAIAAAVAVLALAAPAGAGDCALVGAGQALDAGSTLWAREQGAHEAHPLFQNRGVMLAAKAATAGVGCLGARELRKRGHDKWATWLSRGMFALGAVLAVHNVRQGVLERERGRR